MSQVSGDGFINGNIEGTYDQLSQIINAKNDIINNASACAKKLNENEEKVEELEKILRNIRSGIIFNPIQEKINVICQEDEVLQRKSAEHIYTELQNTSSSMDLCELNDIKLNEEFQQFEELLTTVENTLDKVEQNRNIEVEILRKKIDDINEESKKLFNSNNELKISIETKSKYIASEEGNLKLLENHLANKQIAIQRLSDIFTRNTEALSSLLESKEIITTSFNKDLASLEESESLLEQEIADLTVKISNSNEKLKELREKLIVQKKCNEELSAKIITLKNKKYLYDAIQIQKTIDEQGLIERKAYEENIAKQDKSLSDIRTELEHWENKKNEITFELNRQRELNEGVIQEKHKHYEKMKLLQENSQKLEIELDILQKANKLKEQTIQKLLTEEVALIDEKKQTEENLAGIKRTIDEMNENISQLQADIEIKKKLSKASEIETMEKENKELDQKIVKYLKATDRLKKQRALERAKVSRRESRTHYLEYTDSSQDSMLISKRKRK